MSRDMRDSDREQTWVEVEVVTDPGDPGPIGLEPEAGRAVSERVTIHVEPADDTLTFWAEGPDNFTASSPRLADVVTAVEGFYTDPIFELAMPSIWWRFGNGKWEPMP